ncbi:MAG: phytanoyl-CoA dioxygenase family protein [Planctomycetaceae bacterium]|nr:phytanoyl-CoA dioxygenase family protein [Planctomycetaceae bacterium]
MIKNEMLKNNYYQDLKQTYLKDGFISGVKMLEVAEATRHRKAMEITESKFGPLHYKSKVHTILRSPLQLATLPAVLDLIEELIGPDILLYNVTYIVKEAGTKSHVSWHQDLNYWGLSHDDQVSMWLALSPASEESGCMRMIPESHVNGRQVHDFTEDKTNVLLQGQTVKDVDEDKAVMCSLEPGEASFHHGWTLHSSLPNNSKDRRIGLNAQYLASHVSQTKNYIDSAMLVRGRDIYNHFMQDMLAEMDLEPAAVARQVELETRYIEIAGTG